MVDALRRGGTALCTLLVVAALLVPAPAALASPTAPTLPAPTGDHPVGTGSTRLVDPGRADPWKPDTPYRELMVSLWYPALLPWGERAPYLSEELSAAIIGSDFPAVPPEAFATVRTHATTRALPKPSGHGRPLVVLSPGFGASRTSLTTLAEDLASRGYVVAAIDHTYESPVEFPGGRIEPCLICADIDEELAAEVVRSRARDVSFVLDRLTDRRSPTGRLIDGSRIAMIGHSIGGAAALETMRTDPRVDAGMNMDGALYTGVPGGLDRPFLLFGARRVDHPELDPTWNRVWPRLTGWKRWLDVASGGHWTFSDAPWLAGNFPIREGLPPGQAERLLGSIEGERAVRVVREYLAAFVVAHLRGQEDPLLDGPSPKYPEVSFVPG
ncbi:alpha/beta hydrolase family protein [Amycolatopsis aidingensis]|uniref:alpha/beta hydrolase family protein n=1 Tax=Amycolatopsis aidingensis TaxID=2842453 RepID=UPI001C0E4316|nr:alpha/beta hydrolase [Amycolatopsis aidingensis]